MTNQDLFEDKAKDWDTRDVPRQLSAGIGACIVDNVELHDGMEVLDFGAGTGLIARAARAWMTYARSPKRRLRG